MNFWEYFLILYSLHDYRARRTSGLILIKIAERVNGHLIYLIWYLNIVTKVLCCIVYVGSWIVLKSGEVLQKAIIVNKSQEIRSCHLKCMLTDSIVQ